MKIKKLSPHRGFWEMKCEGSVMSLPFPHRINKIKVLTKLTRFLLLQFFKYFIHIKSDDDDDVITFHNFQQKHS